MNRYSWLVLVVVCAPVARAEEGNVTGTWKSSFTTPNGTMVEFTFEFEQEGGQLSGLITDPGGTSSAIQDAQLKDGKISFTYLRERNEKTFVGKYRGTASGDTIKGTTEYVANGQSRGETPWEARRISALTRPRTEWKFDDLAPAVTPLGRSRSLPNGKQMFQLANCVACHRMEGVGKEFGPDLARLDPKTTAADILRSILEPSTTINEKYQAYVFETASGKILTGLVLEESPEAIKIIANPLASAAPVVLRPSEIAQRAKSPSSLMPKGLVDKLTREEILDLVAYIAAGGKSDRANSP